MKLNWKALKLSRERTILLSSALAGLLIATFLAWFGNRYAPVSDPVNDRDWQRIVWQHIERTAKHHDLNPDFVYAIAWAESSLRPNARTDVARGIMQLTKGAWQTVSTDSYQRAWDWRQNINIGIAYLADNKKFLEDNEAFSYPMLAASFRFGRNAMLRREFLIENIPSSRNRIYQQLFAGETNPVKRP